MFSAAASGVENSTAASTPLRAAGVSPAPCRLFWLLNLARTSKPYSGPSCSMSRPIFPYPTIARPKVINLPVARRAAPRGAALPCAHKFLRLPLTISSRCALPRCVRRECCLAQSETVLPTDRPKPGCPWRKPRRWLEVHQSCLSAARVYAKLRGPARGLQRRREALCESERRPLRYET